MAVAVDMPWFKAVIAESGKKLDNKNRQAKNYLRSLMLFGESTRCCLDLTDQDFELLVEACDCHARGTTNGADKAALCEFRRPFARRVR